MHNTETPSYLRNCVQRALDVGEALSKMGTHKVDTNIIGENPEVTRVSFFFNHLAHSTTSRNYQK